MVKFSKELEAQLIPEWKDAFVNYWQLKKHVKKIKLARKPRYVPHNINYDYGASIFDPVRILMNKVSDWMKNKDEDPQIIQVKSKILVGEDGEEEDVEVYETELVQLFSQEDEVKMFFEMLDDELNKVNQFYKTRESEFLERGEILNKQLQILLDLKRVLDEWRRKNVAANRVTSKRFSRSNSSSLNSEFSESHSASPTDSQTDDVIETLEKNGINFVNTATRAKSKKGKPKMRMRIDIPATTPTRTIAAVTSMLWEDVVNNPKKEGGEYINRKKIQCAEKMIRGAFVELYKGLGLLKKYSSLNMMAFTKILKKFDKVSNQQASASYLKVVKKAHFISSDKVVRLMDEVETLFTQNFTNSDRKKAMKFLKPQQNTESHMVTFFVGLFTGCFATLFSVYAILAHLSGIFSPVYMETVYPIFSMFALLSLHLFMYGCNLFMWKNTRINHNFIFEFQPSTALKYRDAFLICTSLMTAVVGAMIIHLILLSTGLSPHQVDMIPGILVLLFVLFLVCPFNIFYRSTRFCFLRVIRNIVCSPFYKVLMVDFFMADQLTSQITLLRHMESAACYFLAGSFKTHQYETCKSGKLYRELAYVISFAPYYWRAMQIESGFSSPNVGVITYIRSEVEKKNQIQKTGLLSGNLLNLQATPSQLGVNVGHCARRWFDESNSDNLANLGKYVSAMVAAWARLTYAREPSNLWMIIVLLTSMVATVYQLYWDFVKDWGIFDPKSKNPWLRDDLMLKNKGVYYVSIALNLVLRIAWVETVMHFNIGAFKSHLLDFFLASLEVIRRGHWNYYRLENEHLNNVGKFRAVKTVPLPFREMDSDG